MNIYAHIAQSVEHFLGKEEVTGSNPVMSSRQYIFKEDRQWLKKNLKEPNPT